MRTRCISMSRPSSCLQVATGRLMMIMGVPGTVSFKLCGLGGHAAANFKLKHKPAARQPQLGLEVQVESPSRWTPSRSLLPVPVLSPDPGRTTLIWPRAGAATGTGNVRPRLYAYPEGIRVLADSPALRVRVRLPLAATADCHWQCHWQRVELAASGTTTGSGAPACHWHGAPRRSNLMSTT